MQQGLTYRVAAEVRAEMARQRVSQAALGQALGIAQPQVSRRLRGEIAFDTRELEAVAAFLGVPVSAFFAGTHPGPSHPGPTHPGPSGPATPGSPPREVAA